MNTASQGRNPASLLERALDHAGSPVLVLDAQRRIVHVNQAFSELLGYPAGQVLGHDPGALFPSPSLSDEELARHRALPWGKERFHTEIRARHKAGHDIHVRISTSPFDDGPCGYSVDVLHDSSAEQCIRDLERDALEALTSDLPFAALGNYLCRRIEQIISGVLVTLCRIEDGRLRPWAAPSFPPEYGPSFEGMCIGEGVASFGTSAHRRQPVMVRDIASEPLWTPYKHIVLPHGLRACWTYPMLRRDGSVAGTFAFYFRDSNEPVEYLESIAKASVHLCLLAIEREENRQRINQLVQFDTLTGLPNRGYLTRHINELLAAPIVRSIAFFKIDLDRFKDINDALGHAAGDLALVTLANRLRGRLASEQFLSRTEGDQFLVVVPNCDAYGASRLAERLQAIIGEQIILNNLRLHLSASIGISHYPDGGREADALLAGAKQAMYRVKQSGGGSYQFFSPEMNLIAQDRLLLSAALKRALAAGRLRLHYQPQVRTDSGELHGLEALARWHDDELGHIPPSRFITVAEETGQIEALGHWALGEACQQMAQWRAAGVQVPTVSVNLSPINFQNRNLPEFIAALLDEFTLPGHSLTIEITESTVMALTPQMLDVVHRIRAQGVGLSVDDFGTGFSSLSNLVNLPVTEVKIDRSFIDRCAEESRLQSLVAAVIGIGHNLGLTVVAEGVETQAQRTLLGQYHCPVLQGYLFSRPLSPDETLKWLSNALPRVMGKRKQK
ncbi:oxygen-sensing cyclic-di-GMP phosphodiesterase DosP [Pseudomonas sp. LRF_L74]|uniref:oxygen-sensing cyclic-di-GMP phosphodiesterase DosP n=1 Tax=Pseudomonas sp. LRF_L74 TaxID=3369422 RepID=UPI003F5E057D